MTISNNTTAVAHTDEPVWPIFVGGTGRSGTTILADLLGQHPDIRRIRRELKFLTTSGGLCDTYTGDITPGDLVIQLREHWWDWTNHDGDPDGLVTYTTRDEFDEAADRYLTDVETDKQPATARFIGDLLGHDTWVEDTPGNATRMHTLARIFPNARFVHISRDGRDTAASVAKAWWGPDNITDGLTWWHNQMAAIRDAEAHTAGRRRIHIQLEDLARQPSTTVNQLTDWLGLPRAAIDITDVNPRNAHIGRWKRGRTHDQQTAINDHYDTPRS